MAGFKFLGLLNIHFSLLHIQGTHVCMVTISSYDNIYLNQALMQTFDRTAAAWCVQARSNAQNAG